MANLKIARDVQLEHAYPSVRGSRTFVLKCGEVGPNKVIILIIPGNPGVALYYEEFMRMLYGSSGGQTPVWCVSHAGHGIQPRSEVKVKEKVSEDLYSLHGQIQHKFHFIEELVPRDARLILIGHSIGCYVILHLLKYFPPERVIHALLLFPTIERLAMSAQGKYATPGLKYFRWLAPLPLYLVYYLTPHWMIRSLLKWYFKGRNTPPCAIDATATLANPWSIRNITNMANEEMQKVLQADYNIIARNMERLMFYYGKTDHWCPVEYYEDMKARFPEANVQLCQEGLEHAFVLESSQEMAHIVWQYLLDNIEGIDTK